MAQLRPSRLLGGLTSIARMLATADFRAPLRTSLALTRGTGAPTFTRATTATVVDHEGVLRTCLAGEARFTGARLVRNIIPTTSEDYSNAAWTKGAVTVGDAIANPVTGAVTALKIKEDGTTADHRIFIGTGFSFTVGNVYIYSFYAKSAERSFVRITSATGCVIDVVFNLGTGVVTSNVAGVGSITSVGSGWYRCSVVATATVSATSNMQFRLQSDATTTSYAGTTGSGAYAFGAQLEDITGRTDQTTPSEYVSVGAICMDGDDNYLSLPGTAGNYASTPDSVAASITGDIDIRVKAALTDWTPASEQTLIAKWDGATNRSYLFTVAAARLRIYISTTGSASLDGAPLSTAGVSFVDGSVGWCRVTHSASTGDYKFYTSSDGTTWTQLGATVAGTAGSIYDSGYPVEVGASTTGSLFPLNGKIYQAQIYNGIAGTLAIDFNPDRDATTPTGSMASSTTGEVWTINGASSLVRNNTYHGTGVDGVKCFDTTLDGVPIPTATLKGYLAEGARTNLCLQSNAFSTTWTNGNLSTITQNSTGPDGSSTSAWTLTDSVGGVNSFISQSITLVSGSTYTLSIFVKKTSGAQSSYPMFLVNDSVTGAAICTVDTSNGVATIWTALTGFALVSSSASCQSFNSTFWRVSLTFTSNSNNAWTFVLYPAGTSNASQSSGTGVTHSVTGSTVFYGAQVEAGPTATSYTPTTATAVTRNADVLTYPDTGNISDTAGTSYVEFSAQGVTGLTQLVLARDTNGRFPYINTFADRTQLYDGTTQNNATAGASFINSTQKSAQSWGAGTKSVSYAGTAIASSAYDGTQGSGAIAIGCNNTGTENLGGNIAEVCIWTRKLPDAILKRISK